LFISQLYHAEHLRTELPSYLFDFMMGLIFCVFYDAPQFIAYPDLQ